MPLRKHLCLSTAPPSLEPQADCCPLAVNGVCASYSITCPCKSTQAPFERRYMYQVGGSLRIDSPSYVVRQADHRLYNALINGEFCYVFTCRQMGKSSLRVRTKRRLQEANYRCASVDITQFSSQTTTPAQWYKGIAFELWQNFDLFEKVNFNHWWEQQAGLSPVQRLSQFIRKILLVYVPGERFFIFVDEIDSVSGLSFPADDFFAVIRSCYNQRADDSTYQRIVFAFFGVATPSDLIRDRNRTPFNVGQAIQLHDFKLHEAEPLIHGLKHVCRNPDVVLSKILDWTGGQPFLTQKLCQLMIQADEELQQNGRREMSSLMYTPHYTCPVAAIVQYIDQLVQTQIIDNWELQDIPEHLKTIRNYLLENEKRTGRLLGIYQRILEKGEVYADDSDEQTMLLLSGLVVKHCSMLTVRNRIYQSVFNQSWVEQQLSNLRPYAEALKIWVESDCKDDSRLLRGQALKDTLLWAQNRNLSNLDYQFLSASQTLDQLEQETRLEAEFAKAVKERFDAERKSTRRQSLWLIAISVVLMFAICFGQVALDRSYQAATSELQATVSLSEALYASNQRLDALMAALSAWQMREQLGTLNNATQMRVEQALRQAVYRTVEHNRFANKGIIPTVAVNADGTLIAASDDENTFTIWSKDGRRLQTFIGHRAWVSSLAFSPDRQTIASASLDRTVKLWRIDGTLLLSLKSHQDGVNSIAFSPDGQWLASASHDRSIKLWRTDGTLLNTLESHQDVVEAVAISPDGTMLASASRDRSIKLWSSDGLLLHTLRGHQDGVETVAFSPDGKTIASAGRDHLIKLWSSNGRLLRTLEAHQDWIGTVVFSPDGKTLASASRDNTIKLWHSNGTYLRSLEGHRDQVWGIAFFPDGQSLVSASRDFTIRLWHLEGQLLNVLYGHKTAVIAVDMSADGRWVVSGSEDNTLRLWNNTGELLHTFMGHDDMVMDVAFSPDDSQIASASWDGTAKLWNREGELLKTLRSSGEPIWGVAFSPDGRCIATTGKDKTIQLWSLDGELLKTLRGHRDIVWPIAFSPDGQTIASGSWDQTIKLWSLDGTLLKTLYGHRGVVNHLSFSPDGQLLVSGGHDKLIKLWTINGEFLREFKGHKAAVKGVAFSPDGQTIASGSWDKMVKIWNLQGQVLATLNGHNGAIWKVAFSPTGEQLASASGDKTVIVWNLKQVVDIQTVLQHGCSSVQDFLTTNPNSHFDVRMVCQRFRTKT